MLWQGKDFRDCSDTGERRICSYLPTDGVEVFLDAFHHLKQQLTQTLRFLPTVTKSGKQNYAYAAPPQAMHT